MSLLLVACQPAAETESAAEPESDPVQEIFERNSQTLLAYMEAWQNESMDFEQFFSQDFESWSTEFGQSDTIRFADIPAAYAQAWEMYDFELITEPLVLLPGVDIDSKEMDGSVRYYGEWRITLPASDSTEEKSATIQVYEAFTFDEEGKITLNLTYADFGGLNAYLHGEN